MSNEVGRATFDKGGVLPPIVVVYGGPTRREKTADRIAMKAWVGRNRRFGLSHWSNGRHGAPLICLGPEGTYTDVFKPPPGCLKSIRIPGTGWCLSTYRRKARRRR